MCLETQLTPRQYQVVQMLLGGSDHEKVARDLQITRHTLKQTVMAAARRAGIAPIKDGPFNPTLRLVFMLACEQGLLAGWTL
jgi:DNA-binding NarL/FixJ family response regulator